MAPPGAILPIAGNITFAAVDLPEFASGTAESIADVIKLGYAVERTTVAATRGQKWMCLKEPRDV